ncbi:queuosine precursor transporter [bacterium]|nr:queuosine precursor transporter [bacterium]
MNSNDGIALPPSAASAHKRRELVFLILAGIFVTNAIVAELIGGKLFTWGPFTMSLGVLPWPVVFLATDLVNEYFGKNGVRRLTFLTVALIIYAFAVLFIGIVIPAAGFSPVDDEAFQKVFGQSLWIIFGSLVAFLVSQFVDVFVFWAVRAKTEGKYLWLRATGSTAVSQLIDTFVILGIAFYLPGKLSLNEYMITSASNYSYKLAIAVALTPLIYLGHNVIDRFLGERQAEDLIEEAAEKSLHGK